MKSYLEKIKEIQDELKWNAELFESDIKIEIDNDIVTLNGTVENERKRHEAEIIVSKMEGVKSVVNNLQISEVTHSGEGPLEVPSPNAGDADNSLKLSGA
jgi:hypothetical protein